MKNLIGMILVICTSTGVTASETTQLYWGDTHLHTSISADVYMFDTRSATADTAYRFAKGFPVISPVNGQRMRIDQPLDFLVIADHAEALGSFERLYNGDPELVNTPSGQALLNIGFDTPEKLISAYGATLKALFLGKDEATGLIGSQIMSDMHSGEKRRGAWQNNIEAAERYNEPGKFTAFIGWEWSSQPNGANLHRVVVTDSGAEKASQYLPYSMFESPNPEDLWNWLDETSRKTGANFVAIPHNSNISRGQMFSVKTFNNNQIDADYGRTRMKWEPIAEITQIKGDSETHPLLSPRDEFASFETFDFVLLPSGERDKPTSGDYARSALKSGLELKQQTGVNPFKFGMIGSTDSHTGMSAVAENNFSGKAKHDSIAQRRSEKTGIGASVGWDMSAGGFVGVWARENTRKGLMEAFKSKEVYASTGPRMVLRFFGGWNFETEDAEKSNLVQLGYSKGVPMGGDLIPQKTNASPTFLIAASKDPLGANLDLVQVVKGWLNKDGKAQEKVYDVAWSGNRQLDNNSNLPAVGNTVNETTAGYSNTIGASALVTVWQDPDFDAELQAFYYVRVMEIPTPRYSLYDSVALDLPKETTGHPTIIQERVYSSPIWYTP